MSKNRVTKDEFRAIKNKLRWQKPAMVATKMGRHLATVLKIQASQRFEDYQRLVRAEHPPVKNSLGDKVAELERWRKQEVDPYLTYEQRGKTQMALDLNREGINGSPKVK